VFTEPLHSKWVLRFVITETCVNEPFSGNRLFRLLGLMSQYYWLQLFYSSTKFPLCVVKYLSMYGSAAPADLGRFFSFLICAQSVRFLGRGISPTQGRCLHTVFRAGEDSSCLRPRGHSNRLWYSEYPVFFYTFIRHYRLGQYDKLLFSVAEQHNKIMSYVLGH
jgi:hypothetical protein